MSSESHDPAIRWQKSSYSLGAGECVEFAEFGPDAIGVRDSKDPSGPVLTFSRNEIRAFLRGASEGEFDRFG